MSIDIFSVKAIENIAVWLARWSKQWETGLDLAHDQNAEDIEDLEIKTQRDLKFIGYVSQQYIAKRDASGTKRAVSAYDKIMSQFDSIIREKLLSNALKERVSDDYNLGSVPNLHSLIPMSQTSRAPIFGLRASDGVRGAHFTKVKDSRETFGRIANKIQNEIALEELLS